MKLAATKLPIFLLLTSLGNISPYKVWAWLAYARKKRIVRITMKNTKDREDKIMKALSTAPHGLWVREIARKAGIDKSTASRHLEAMGEKIEFEFLGRNKVFRLRQS